MVITTELTVDLQIALPELRARFRLVEALNQCRVCRIRVLLPLNFHGKQATELDAVLVISDQLPVPASVNNSA